jgi:hypothetical protein
MVTAVIAFEASVGGLQSVGFTGRIDQVAVSGNGYPKIPLGAARGSEPDESLALATPGTTPMDAMEKARAVGQLRMASLIGTVGTGPSQKDGPGETVFMANVSKPTFNDGGDENGPASSSSTLAFAPSSTSTATITMAGAGNSSRQWAGGGTNFVVAANSLQAAPAAQTDAVKGVDLTEAAQPTLGYNYAPTANSAAKGNEMQATFSDAVSATGDLAQIVTPLTVAQAVTPLTLPGQRGLSGSVGLQTSDTTTRPGRSNEILTSQNQKAQSIDGPANGRTQTSQAQPVAGRSNEILTSQIQRSQFQALESAGTKKPAELVEALLDPNDGQQGDGTRTFLSTSVSANPSESAATYLASVIRRTPDGSTSAASVEAFEVGPAPGAKTTADASTTVPAPLGGKILASVGPLNSALALP